MRVSNSPAAVVIIMLLVLAPLLYVASTGPAVWCVTKGYMGEEALRTAYWPLVKLSDNCEPIGTALNHYVELWDPGTTPTPPPPARPVMAAPVPAPVAGS